VAAPPDDDAAVGFKLQIANFMFAHVKARYTVELNGKHHWAQLYYLGNT
jgi:hypothetical protein